ncbi:stage V sporulation protein D [Heliorestis convoluta]|uniref:Stage V sporulation protein D n=1 Tax=Heliorestis convoluta TaxID=356322 RepID=A0A5Q2MYV7_9FIRM|nr:stage V sporulation protein D [Heliorestis convoluta]QGG47847.1 stage V sporulation protein D [Heliorestis convoluta]
MFATPVQVKKRSTQLFLFLAFLMIVLIGRLFWIQVIKGDFYASKAEEVRLRDLPVEAKRGTIYDRNMRSLAVSISVDSVVANPAEVRRRSDDRIREMAQQMSTILEMDEDDVYERITRTNTGFVWVRRKVDPDKVAQLRQLDLPGIDYIPESRRYYEKGKLASHVLGITDIDSRGLEGLELIFDQQMRGVPGKLVAEYDAANRELPQAQHAFIRPVDGHSVVLTIDETIQYIVERELDKLERERNPKGATVIVMEAKTGRILALSNRPTFDPNERHLYPDTARRNRAINDIYEPGSTFKIVTAAAAMEERVVGDKDNYQCPGYIMIDKLRLRCWKHEGHGQQDFTEVVENSCNPGFVTVGMNLGLDKFYKYLHAFGFGTPTGIPMNGEAGGILVPRNAAKPIDLATMSIGQANAMTPIQLITAVSAVANDGKLMKPQLVEKVIDAQGAIVEKFEPEMIRQVVSKETAEELNLILESVVSNGTGRNAYLQGYRVGGKTGTAQKIKPGGGYMEREYVASFVGLAPANDPEIVCLVVVDAPEGMPYYGGLVAAPIFRSIMVDTLRHLGIQPQAVQDQAPTVITEGVREVVVPQVTGIDVTEASQTLRGVSLGAATEGFGSRVIGQLPQAGEVVAPRSTVILYLDDHEEVFQAEVASETICPDIRGKTIRQASELLTRAGLSLEMYGTGLAYRQSIPAGTKVPVGTVVRVDFLPFDEQGP